MASGSESDYSSVPGAPLHDESSYLRCPSKHEPLGAFFWRVELLRRSVTSGVSLSPDVFVHSDVWRQEGVRIQGMTAKVGAVSVLVKSGRGLRQWIVPSMPALRQLVQSPQRLKAELVRFQAHAQSVAQQLRASFDLDVTGGQGGDTQQSGGDTRSRRTSSQGGGASAGSGASAGAGSSSQHGSPVTSVAPPVPPRRDISPAAAASMEVGAGESPQSNHSDQRSDKRQQQQPKGRSGRASFSASMSRFGSSLFSMVSKGVSRGAASAASALESAASAIEKISASITAVRVKAEDLRRYSRMVSDLCDELLCLHAWTKLGHGIAAPSCKPVGDNTTGTPNMRSDGGTPFGHVCYPAEMGEAEQAAWVGLVRSMVREDAVVRSALIGAVNAVNGTILELLLRDLSMLATRYLTAQTSALMNTSVGTVVVADDDDGHGAVGDGTEDGGGGYDSSANEGGASDSVASTNGGVHRASSELRLEPV